MGSTGSSGGGALVQLSRVVLAASAASISFPGIAATYENLFIDFIGRADAVATVVTLCIRFNGDTATNYNTQELLAQATTAVPNDYAAIAYGYVGLLPAASAPAGQVGVSRIRIPGYARTTYHKVAQASGGGGYGAANALAVDSWAVEWLNTVAINQVDLLPNNGNLLAGSVATLYAES